MESLAELIGAAGMMHPNQITPDYLMCRDGTGKAISMGVELANIKPGSLLGGVNSFNEKDFPREYGLYWNRASVDKFGLK
jgi:hypothetical protein